MYVVLPAGISEIVRAVVRGPGAWATAEQLAERMGCKTATTVRWIAAAVDAGWITEFPWDDDAVYTLSGHAVAKLGLELAPDDLDDGEHWTRRGRGLGVASKHLPCEGQIDLAEIVTDPSPGPAEQAIAAEETEIRAAALVAGTERQSRILPRRAPRPTLIITGSESVWREWGYSPRGCNVLGADGRWRSRSSAICVKLGIKPRAPSSCSACRLLPLGNNATCLRCSRYGWSEPRAFVAKRAVAKRVKDVA